MQPSSYSVSSCGPWKFQVTMVEGMRRDINAHAVVKWVILKQTPYLMIKSINSLLPQPLFLHDKKDIWLGHIEDSELLIFMELVFLWIWYQEPLIYNSRCILYSNATWHIVHPPSKAYEIYGIATNIRRFEVEPMKQSSVVSGSSKALVALSPFCTVKSAHDSQSYLI